jgi:hypothetical protein
MLVFGKHPIVIADVCYDVSFVQVMSAMTSVDVLHITFKPAVLTMDFY